MIDIPTMININVDDLLNWLENSPHENDHIAAKLIETLVAATETKHQDFRELELKLSDYVEVEETNRGLVKRGDFWEARAEALQARVALQDKEIRTLGNAGVNLLDRAEAAEAKVAELTAALTEIAKQKHPLEMTLQWKDNADFEDGYAACVDCARAALKKD